PIGRSISIAVIEQPFVDECLAIIVRHCRKLSFPALQPGIDRQTCPVNRLRHIRVWRESRLLGITIDRGTQSSDMKFRPDLSTIDLYSETDEIVLVGLWQNDIVDGAERHFGHRERNARLDIRLAH